MPLELHGREKHVRVIAFSILCSEEVLPQPQAGIVILFYSLQRVEVEHQEPPGIHIVLKVCNLDTGGKGVFPHPLDELFVRLRFSLRQTFQGLKDLLRVTLLPQICQSTGRVFDHVVQDADDLLDFRIEFQHDSKHVQDIGLS
jgi:hypothetical protein